MKFGRTWKINKRAIISTLVITIGLIISVFLVQNNQDIRRKAFSSSFLNPVVIGKFEEAIDRQYLDNPYDTLPGESAIYEGVTYSTLASVYSNNTLNSDEKAYIGIRTLVGNRPTSPSAEEHAKWRIQQIGKYHFQNTHTMYMYERGDIDKQEASEILTKNTYHLFNQVDMLLTSKGGGQNPFGQFRNTNVSGYYYSDSDRLWDSYHAQTFLPDVGMGAFKSAGWGISKDLLNDNYCSFVESTISSCVNVDIHKRIRQITDRMLQKYKGLDCVASDLPPATPEDYHHCSIKLAGLSVAIKLNPDWYNATSGEKHELKQRIFTKSPQISTEYVDMYYRIPADEMQHVANIFSVQEWDSISSNSFLVPFMNKQLEYIEKFNDSFWYQGWQKTLVSDLNLPVNQVLDFNQSLGDASTSNQQKQTFLSQDGRTVYSRQFANGAWGSWQSQTVRSFNIPQNNGSALNTIRSFNQAIIPETNTPKQEVLTSDGQTIYWRRFENNAWGNTWSVLSVNNLNLPVDRVSDFQQTNGDQATGNNPKQTFLSWDGEKIYTRIYNSGWQSWQEIVVGDMNLPLGQVKIRSFNQTTRPDDNTPKQDVITDDGKAIYYRFFEQGWPQVQRIFMSDRDSYDYDVLSSNDRDRDRIANCNVHDDYHYFNSTLPDNNDPDGTVRVVAQRGEPPTSGMLPIFPVAIHLLDGSYPELKERWENEVVALLQASITNPHHSIAEGCDGNEPSDAESTTALRNLNFMITGYLFYNQTPIDTLNSRSSSSRGFGLFNFKR